MQTTLSASLCVLFFAGVAACSSEPTGSKGGGGGNGSVINGSGGTSTAASGTSSQSAGSNGSPVGGASTGTSGAATGGAATAGAATAGAATAGSSGASSAAQECLDTPITCVDEDTISGCNPDTLMNETLNCKELIDSQGPGLKTEGCAVIEGRSVCSYDFEDTACRDAAPAFAVCYEAATGQTVDPLIFYFDCFSDFMYDLAEEGAPEMLVGAHGLITCFSDYVTDNTVDCAAAEEACFPSSSGAGTP